MKKKIGFALLGLVGATALYFWYKNKKAKDTAASVKALNTAINATAMNDYTKKAEIATEAAKKVLTPAEIAKIEVDAKASCELGCAGAKVQSGQAYAGCMSGCVPSTIAKMTVAALAKK